MVRLDQSRCHVQQRCRFWEPVIQEFVADRSASLRSESGGTGCGCDSSGATVVQLHRPTWTCDRTGHVLARWRRKGWIVFGPPSGGKWICHVMRATAARLAQALRPRKSRPSGRLRMDRGLCRFSGGGARRQWRARRHRRVPRWRVPARMTKCCRSSGCRSPSCHRCCRQIERW